MTHRVISEPHQLRCKYKSVADVKKALPKRKKGKEQKDKNIKQAPLSYPKMSEALGRKMRKDAYLTAKAMSEDRRDELGLWVYVPKHKKSKGNIQDTKRSSFPTSGAKGYEKKRSKGKEPQGFTTSSKPSGNELKQMVKTKTLRDEITLVGNANQRKDKIRKSIRAALGK